MREDVLINVQPFETRVALLHNGSLQELHLERSSGASVTGNIYRGRVIRILPGMQAAFVDVGLDRPGFLHAKDVRGGWRQGESVRADAGPPPIEHLLSEGASLLVQVTKDPIANKGARLTTHIALPSRFLVLMPHTRHVGVSQRIEDPDERDRLRSLVESCRDEGVGHCQGYIVRTVAEGAGADEIAADMTFLRRVWQRVELQASTAAPSALVYEELPVQVRVIRDLVGAQVASIQVDCADTFSRAQRFVTRFAPEMRDRLVAYTDPVPLFERFGVEEDLARALDTRVPLKSGGYLVIEQTEAMTTIDVNTGGFVGTRTLEETVFKTNLEAAAVIPRQLRLRNLGGIIVVDFIDMEDHEHQRQVLRVLEKACELDPARIRVSGISELGLVEMSRKRTRESLAQQLCEPCHCCAGRGVVRTPESTCYEILRAILRDARKRGPALPGSAYLIRAGQTVLDRLLDENASDLATVSGGVDRPIRLQVEPSYTVEQFDVVLMQDLD